jgi:putative ABC transport system ATP-binding protein
MDSALHTRNLTRRFAVEGGWLTVVDDVSLTVPTGATCAIVGPSGSGKTTLLGLCAGLDRASAGSVHLLGQDLGLLDEEQRARLRREHTGFIFQAFHLLPTLTALENVMLPLELRRAPDARSRAEAWLQRVGLEARLHHEPARLSGGEQQRVAIARAFASEPRVLFADEPTGNLDAVTGETIIDLLFGLNTQSNTTLVLVTHDTEIARRCGWQIRLRGGRVVESIAPPAP